MIKRKAFFTILFALFLMSTLLAQKKMEWGLKNNILEDILLCPNLHLQAYASSNLLFSLGGTYGWWDFNWSRKNAFQQWNINLESSYFLKKDYSFTGHHFGLSVQTGQFDYKRKEKAKRGHFATAGLLYGYTWKLSDYFYLDAGLAVGYIYSFYHKYTYSPEYDHYCCIEHPTKHLLGITNLNVSLIYRFKKGGRK